MSMVNVHALGCLEWRIELCLAYLMPGGAVGKDDFEIDSQVVCAWVQT